MGWVTYTTTHNDIATACNEVDDHFMLMEYGKRKRSRPPPGFASIFLLLFGREEGGWPTLYGLFIIWFIYQ